MQPPKAIDDTSHRQQMPNKETNLKETNIKEVLLEPKKIIPSIKDAKPDFLKAPINFQFAEPAPYE